MCDRDVDTEILDAWPRQEPPDDFAEHVVAEAMQKRLPEGRDEPQKPRRRAWLLFAAAVAAAAALWITQRRDVTAGAITAEARREVAIGDRVVAVLEPSASVSWNGETLEQHGGDVFYRVEPGNEVVVRTPSGVVTVLGTCFRVRVFPARSEDQSMNRDIKVGTAALVVGAVTVVGVYEGKVRLTHAGQSTELSAGEMAAATEDGIRALDERALEALEQERAAAKAQRARPTGTSPAEVAALQKRLGALEKQRASLEKNLKDTQADLDAATSGEPRRDRHAFDLDERDWAELAETGAIKYRLPCENRAPGGTGWRPNGEQLDALGLAPDDADVIQDAYAASQERMGEVWRPLCIDAIGKPEVVDAIGRNTCIHLVLNMAHQQDAAAAREAMRMVGEIRAGERPMPAEGEGQHPLAELFLGITGEMAHFEADLAQAFGPDEAKRIAYADGMCGGTSHFGGAPRD